MTVVVDASVVVAALASAGVTGEWAERVLAGESLAAPHLMPVEAASILHRAELAGEISADAASLAHADLRRLRVEYFPYDPFAGRIWELRSPGPAATPGPPERARLLVAPGPASGGTDDPAQMPGEDDEQQVTMLARVLRRGADLATERKRVELQMRALAKSSGKLERRASEARAAGQPGLAQESLARKNAAQAELGELKGQHQSLRQEEDRLAAAAQRLQATIDARRRQEQAGERGGHPGLTSYEAWYVALAEFLGAKLATLDTRLALTPGPRCGFRLPPPPAEKWNTIIER
jgi:predicted nucleic acid-binding protein